MLRKCLSANIGDLCFRLSVTSALPNGKDFLSIRETDQLLVYARVSKHGFADYAADV